MEMKQAEQSLTAARVQQGAASLWPEPSPAVSGEFSVGLEARPRDVKPEPKPLLVLTVGAVFIPNLSFSCLLCAGKAARPLSIPVLPDHFPLNTTSALKHRTGAEQHQAPQHTWLLLQCSGCRDSSNL